MLLTGVGGASLFGLALSQWSRSPPTTATSVWPLPNAGLLAC